MLTPCSSLTLCSLRWAVDLASSTLKEKDAAIIVKGLDVVLDFMEFAGGLYESVAGDAVIKPVVYQGSLGRGKLEQMYGKYIGNNMMSMDEKATDRADQLQSVFGIKDAKAQGIQQRSMMKR